MQQYTIAGALDANYHKGDNRPGNKSNRTKIYGAGTIRRLTPRECERLQGFPDRWTQYGIREDGLPVIVSDTQRYKCLGNAVTVNVINDIMRAIEIGL